MPIFTYSNISLAKMLPKQKVVLLVRIAVVVMVVVVATAAEAVMAVDEDAMAVDETVVARHAMIVQPVAIDRYWNLRKKPRVYSLPVIQVATDPLNHAHLEPRGPLVNHDQVRRVLVNCVWC